MPKIASYDAKQTRFPIDEKAFAAFETAGRRGGPLLNQAAHDYAEIGKLQAEAFRAEGFPLDFAAFGERGGRGGGGSGVRGNINPELGGGSGRSSAVRGLGRDRSGGAGGAMPIAAAKLIDAWGQNTPAIGGDVTVLHGDRGTADVPSLISTDRNGNLSENSGALDSYIDQQARTYGPGAVAREDLPPPAGFTAAPAPAPPSGGFWSDLASSVGNAVSSAGAAIGQFFGEGTDAEAGATAAIPGTGAEADQ